MRKSFEKFTGKSWSFNVVKTMNFNGCWTTTKKLTQEKKSNIARNLISSWFFFWVQKTSSVNSAEKKNVMKSVFVAAAQLSLDFTDAIGVSAYNLYHFFFESLLWSWLCFIWIFVLSLECMESGKKQQRFISSLQSLNLLN